MSLIQGLKHRALPLMEHDVDVVAMSDLNVHSMVRSSTIVE